MATEIPNLWPPEISVLVVKPATILRAAASQIRAMTKGVLDGEVGRTTSQDGKNVLLLFDLIAPALNHYRHRLLTAEHSKNMVYPVKVFADCYDVGGSHHPEKESAFTPRTLTHSRLQSEPIYRVAASEEQLLSSIREIFASRETTGVVQSLLAEMSDVREVETKPADGDKTDDPK